MREAAESEFMEDNKPTLDAFLGECHSEANDGTHGQTRTAIAATKNGRTAE
jgi:hypothetical protein